MKAKKGIGIRNLLFAYSFGLLFIVLLVVMILFSSLFQMVDEMQDRVQQYINLSQFSTLLETAKQNYESLFSAIAKGDDTQAFRLKNQAQLLQVKTNYKAQELKVSYDESHEKYYYSNAISNGLEYLEANQLKIMDISLPVSQEDYATYYWNIKVYDYLLDYSANLYLKEAVSNDVDVLARNIAKSATLRSLTFMAFAGIILLSVAIVIVFTRRFVAPVNKMAQTARDIANGNLDASDLDMWAPSEIESLQNSMNLMKESLLNSITLERELHAKEVEHLRITRELEKARYLSLQAQINPHFLFNALNIISHTALFEQADQTVRLTNTLAGFLRYTLEFHDEVELGKELDFVSSYLLIQKARFGERLCYEITCPGELKSMLIPPLLIQPFVENAINHGLEPKENGGKVTIEVAKERNSVTIKVMDDGVGIIGNPLKSESKSSRVGIKNVHERVKLYFGSKANLKIERVSEQGGTAVILSIPLKKQRSIL